MGTIYVEAIVNLEGDEDTLIDAVTWLLFEEFGKKMEDTDFMDVKVEDAEDWIRSLHGHILHAPESIDGTIKFSYKMAKKLKVNPDKEIGFSSELEDVEDEEGVIVKLGKPINKRYHIKGLSREEFSLVKTE